MGLEKRDAAGTRGYLLRTLHGDLVFRIYGEPDQTGRRPFRDYEIRHHDLRIELLDGTIFEGETKEGYQGFIDYDLEGK